MCGVVSLFAALGLRLFCEWVVGLACVADVFSAGRVWWMGGVGLKELEEVENRYRKVQRWPPDAIARRRLLARLSHSVCRRVQRLI